MSRNINMDDPIPITRAKNGDSNYFKRTPVEHWVKALSAKEGNSVLSTAFESYHIHCAKVIYRRCPELLNQQSTTCSYTTLHHAAYRAHEKPSMIKFVISVADRELYRLSCVRNFTSLQKSIHEHHIEAIELLIEADPDHLTYIDENGVTPLLHALQKSYWKTDNHVSVRMRRLLLKKQPNASRIRTGEHGWTALHYAASIGDPGAIEDIIRFCPDSVHEVDKENRDFLDIASTSGHYEEVKNVLQKKEVWDSILKGNNIQGIERLVSFLSDRGEKTKEVLQVNTMSKREQELCIPPKHLALYRKLVNQFGEIVEPSKCVEEAPAPTYEALGRFLNDVSDMTHVNPMNISQEDISNWEKMVDNYSATGLQLSWFQKLVAQYRGWFQHLHHLDNEIEIKCKEIETKEKEFQIKYNEMLRQVSMLKIELKSQVSGLKIELNNLKIQRYTYAGYMATHFINPTSKPTCPG